MENKQKLLIFVVAYNAETTIEKVLRRIPEDIYDSYDTNVLIIDDSSVDKTFEIGVSFSELFPDKKITVIRNPENQGYGGNQKIGYNYAIKYGYDIVILLHGDAQYAPEYMNELIKPIAGGEADAVFGSRMLKRGAAIKGGMPLYKYVGNKILTFIQNSLMRVRLSEWHSGYRAYARSILELLPFERNENGFPFDTDIILQLIQRKARIKEVAIPTFYGDEICYVNGINYAFHAVLNTFRCRLHNMNLFYERKFDCGPQAESYPLKLGYESSHSLVIDLVPENSTVLDFGCGEGLVARELLKKGCKVIGVDQHVPIERNNFTEFFQCKLPVDNIPWNKDYKFDYVLLMDIIEHISDPEFFLDRLRDWLQGHPCSVIISSANIAFLVPRLQLLLGRFNYVRRGILDMTHRRLFTVGSLKRVLEQSGYKVLSVKGIPAPFPEVVRLKCLALLLVKINHFLILLFKSLFSYQVLITAKPYPNLDFLLSRSLDHSRQRKNGITRQTEG